VFQTGRSMDTVRTKAGTITTYKPDSEEMK
jgi:hypothetical protein